LTAKPQSEKDIIRYKLTVAELAIIINIGMLQEAL
jgi:hypothetical protein